MDEAESRRIADNPEFRKMIDEASRPYAPFKEILVWKFSRFTRKGEHAVAFKSKLRHKSIKVVSLTEYADDTPTGKLMETIIKRVNDSTARIWRRTSREGCARQCLGASGSQAGCPTYTARSTSKTGQRNAPPLWNPTRTRLVWSSASST